MDHGHLDQFGADHHGLLTRRAAERAGISRAGWYRALRDRQFISLYPGIARMSGVPTTRKQRIAAAVLAAQPGAMASHRSAAFLWGVDRPADDPIDVIVTSRTRGMRLDGVVIHRPRDDRDLSPVHRHQIRTSNVLRFLCDLGAVDEFGVSSAVGHVVSRGLASPDNLMAAVEGHARRGRHGVRALRTALTEWVIDGKPADSVLESAMSRLLVRFRLPRATFHARVAGFEVDFLVNGTRVVLECDGWDFHGRTRAQYEHDRERDATLMAAGFVPVHFTYRQIQKRPAVVARRIEGALAVWGSASGATALDPGVDRLTGDTEHTQKRQWNA